MSEENSDELYRRYRPQKFSELIGQAGAVATLNGLGKGGKFPHAILLVGPSGCGKTTAARILRKLLKCSDNDFFEKNAAESRGIDDIRAIQDRMGLSPVGGKARVWLLDEAHALTSDAQSCLLKMLEDTPPHVYFMLATTDPAKLKPTIRTRCTEIKFKALTVAEIKKLVDATAKAEGKSLDETVAAKLAEVAEGSARKALVLLHQVIGIVEKDAQLSAIEKQDVQKSGFDIAMALINGKGWSAVKNVLEAAKEQEPEAIRCVVLAFMRSAMMKGDNDKAYRIALCFKEPSYMWGNGSAAAWAAVTAACYEAATQI